MSYDFEKGEKYLITGPSGIGKTTLLRIIASLDKEYGGRIDGNDCRLSYMFQEDRLLENYSVLDNIRIISHKSEREIRENITQLFDEDISNMRIGELSGGMKRRVALIRAVMTDSAMLLLDEPFSGLDENNTARTLEYIRNNRKGRTLLLASHVEVDDQSFIKIELT